MLVKNLLPQLTLVADQTRNEGQLLDLSGSGGALTLGTFTDVGTLDQHTAQIDWGDGHIQIGAIIEAGGNGMVVGTHTYADDGTYTVTVRIADDDMSGDFTGTGVEGIDYVQQTFTVTVNNVAPIVMTPNGNQTILEGSAVTFNNLATFTDPGFDNPLNPNPAMPPNITDPLHESFTYEINWGDGRDPVPVTAIADINGAPGTPSSGTIGGSHIYADDGTYTVTITVHDDNNGTTIRPVHGDR